MRLLPIACACAGLLAAACESPQTSDSAATGTENPPAAAVGGAGTGDGSASAAPTVERLGGLTVGSAEDFVVNVRDRVLFGFDSFALSEEARRIVANQAAWLRKHPGVNVTLEGHADERGTREYNLALGERRANSVRDHMVELGIAPGRISTISYGKERPVDFASNEDAWRRNRRVVTVVAGGSS